MQYGSPSPRVGSDSRARGRTPAPRFTSSRRVSARCSARKPPATHHRARTGKGESLWSTSTRGQWYVATDMAGLDLDTLGRQIQDRLTESESIEEALAASEYLARRRARLLGREPTQADLEFAASILCWYPFRTLPPEQVQHELALIRESAVSGAAEGDTRLLDETVPDRTLVVDRSELAAQQQRGIQAFLGPAADDFLP